MSLFRSCSSFGTGLWYNWSCMSGISLIQSKRCFRLHCRSTPHANPKYDRTRSSSPQFTPLVLSFYNSLTHSISQMQKRDPSILTGLSTDASSAPFGVNPACGIPRVGTSTVEFGGPSGDSLGNIANIVACGLSIFFVVALIAWTSRRKAAVGEL